MLLQRLQVEEGFLDGLDLEFRPGLNVLIGARGTGKTSVIELLRFGLGASGYTADSTKRSLDHARSVLGSGRVIVHLLADGRRVRVTRSAGDPAPRTDGDFLPPVIFSQTEIESVGLERLGRLRLIDSFLEARRKSSQSEAQLIASIKSLTSEIESKGRDIGAWEDQLAQLAPTVTALKELTTREQQISQSSAVAAARKNTLDSLSIQATALAVKQDVLTRFNQALTSWLTQIESAAKRAPNLESWGGKPGDDPLAEIRAPFSQARKHTAAVIADFQNVAALAHTRAVQYEDQRVDLEEKARALRREIESIQQGAGEVAKTAASLRERHAQLEAIKPLAQELRGNRQRLHEERALLLDQLERVRQDRFEERRAVANRLNKELGPLVRVTIERSGHFEEYIQLITESLRGSGIRYNEVSPLIAQQISPRELLDIVESGDFETMSNLLSISKDRSSRIVAQLRDKSLAEIAVCSVDDTVEFSLLDGREYKSLIDLSTGQRCTVILPVILKHEQRALIVDQPEDHIDNAFIVGTVIKALRNRSKDAQIVFSTHNANIPVIGEADQVVQMGSDGRRGFVVQATELDDPRAVAAIAGIMEGGREAFAQRAKFYKANRTGDERE